MMRLCLVLLLASSLSACFESNGREDAGEGGLLDGAVLADGDAPDGDGGIGDAGTCEPLGATRLCGDFCGIECPDAMAYCNENVHVCRNIDRDLAPPQGVEECVVNLRFGQPYCYTGRLCATSDRWMSSEISWGGTCVSEEYCRWVQDEPSLAHVRCRYTDGFEFENGPPDHECGAGALPENPFCGGQCGDSCPAFLGGFTETDAPACIGRSETRGFGVCTFRSTRCGPGTPSGPDNPFARCRTGIDSPDDITCVCMMLSPVLMEEYADYGWAVSEQTCLAYQARYPGEVRCVPESELSVEP